MLESYKNSPRYGDRSSHQRKKYSAGCGADKTHQQAATKFLELAFRIYDFAAPETNDVLDGGVSAKDFLFPVDWNWLCRKIEIR